jgi:hypothetical protein
MTVEYKVYVGDTPLIKVDCVTDITTISGAQINYKKPVSATTGNWTATVASDPNTNKGRYLEYQSGVSDLDEAGDWKFQAYVVFTDGTRFFGETATQRVHALFE